MTLSIDALIFGQAYLSGPKATLSFGGEGAQMAITPRARAALQELIAAGYAAPTEPLDQIPGREFYRGTDADPHIGRLILEAGIDMFDMNLGGWPSFAKIVAD